MIRQLLAGVLVISGLLTLPAATAQGTVAVSSVDVSFEVRNVNRTLVPCIADGRTHVLRGRLVGPAAALAADAAPRVNLLVHDITAGAWFWSLPGHPSRSYADELARAGEVSLVVDRLGYGASDHPAGHNTCLGAQADMVHQLLLALRTGTYADGSGPAFEQVVLHGHSVGAAIAELAAATWGDADALVLMAWADSGASVRAIAEAAVQNSLCLTRDYAHYGQSDRAYRSLLFAAAPLDVQLTATALRNPDPCGDAMSLAQTVVLLNALTHAIDVPVLLLFGEKDALNRPDARVLQPLAYGPRAEVTAYTLAGAGSALPLEVPELEETVLGWLAGTT